MKKLLLLISTYFLMESSAYAYLDPGTGSAFLAAIVAVFATANTYAKKYYLICKNFFIKIFIKKQKGKNK